jgi:branched-chain amino acid transport system ATP-binding protein
MSEAAPLPARAPILEVKGITKRFGGLVALSDVSFSINKGEIYGLIGPNGAGKTTLFNVLTGIYRQDEGEFRFEGSLLRNATPDRIAKLGIARTFQNIRLFANLSALENVMIGRHVRTRAGVFGAILRGPATRAEERAIEKRAHELLEYVGIEGRRNELAKHLSYGDQRRLEIARALATEPTLLLLDEPVAGMNSTEKTALMREIVNIRGRGYTIFMIEHDMRFVMGLCEEISVLNFGKIIAHGGPEQIRNDPQVIEAYLGREDDEVSVAAGEAE